MLTLDAIFADTVARGWRPVTPAFGPELTALEASHCRGDCTAPLIVDGDLAYIDRTRRAQPGDLAAFALSARGAAAQNSALPAGQSPWCPGQSWIKLLADYRGTEMLLDRHGHSATATLLACESPGDKPQLWPVRQIRRAGRLLFTPPADPSLSRRSMLTALGAGPALAGCDQMAPAMLPPCSESAGDAAEVGLNAATITAVTHSTPAGVSLTGVTGVTTLNPTMTLPSSPPYSCTAIVTLNITARQSTGTVGDVSLLVQFADDGVTKLDSTSSYKVLSASDQQYTLQWEFSHSATNVGHGQVWAAANPGNAADTLVYGPCTLQVEYVIR